MEAWPRGGSPIHIRTSDLTGLPGADQEKVARRCDREWSVTGEGEGSLGLGNPPACASRHSSSIATWGCTGTLPRAGCPSSPCRTHPCWPRARCFGEQRTFQVCRQAESWLGNCMPQVHPSLCLAPRVSICGQRYRKRCLGLDPCP